MPRRERQRESERISCSLPSICCFDLASVVRGRQCPNGIGCKKPLEEEFMERVEKTEGSERGEGGTVLDNLIIT